MVSTDEPWAFGYQRFGNDDLADHLLTIARYRANRALRELHRYPFGSRWGEDPEAVRWLDRATDAGTAVEIMIKHILAKVTPVLILDTKKITRNSILHLTGRSDVVARLSANNDPAPIDALDVATIGASEAVDLVAKMWSSGARFSVRDAKAILNVRNAAIHLGMLSRSTMLTTMLKFIDVMAALVEEAGAPSDFWSVSVSSIERKIRSNTPISVVLQQKIDNARAVAGGKHSMDDFTFMTYLGLTSEEPGELGSTYARDDLPHWRQVMCPTCVSAGVMWGVLVPGSVEYQEDPESGGTLYWIDDEARPALYKCGHCELELTRAEIGEYGIVQRNFSDSWLIGTRDPTSAELNAYLDRYE
ncbi:hypothetical protein ACQ856_30280 (plasmid) [Mycolicibacterium psychrotolerans]|uniref:hypothetical protein n=1 Tax=Mycolicibacterium psychrotolerans TaxID=216929 RepID=UPI003D67F415